MKNSITVWDYSDFRIETLRNEGRKVTADNYGKATRCLWRFCPNKNLTLDDITEDFVADFNSYLYKLNIKKPTISFYNRVLRSIYNRGSRDGLVRNTHPFDRAYTKVEAKLSPVSAIKTDSGNIVTIDLLDKEDLIKRYKSLEIKYNTLVNKLSAMVGI